MKVSHLLLAVGLASLTALSACGGRTHERVMELPGGGPSDAENARTAAANRTPNFFERMMGQDNRPNVGPCPLMGVLYDSSRLVQFDQSSQERYANIAFTGEFRGVRGLCRYVGSDPITMALEIDMALGRGPAAAGADRKTYRYWVAVARRGRVPIAKQYFDVDVRFPAGQNEVTHTEQIERITIPRAAADTSGDNFEVLVGFDLTPTQLAFNRAGKRFRVDAGAQAAAQQQQQHH